MSIKLQLLPLTSASSSIPLKIKVLPSTKISALIHTYLVKSKLPLSQKEHLSVWLEDEELELAATVAEEEISSGEKLRIVYKEKRKVDKGKGRMVEPVVEKGKGKGKGKGTEEPRREEDEEDELDEGPEWDDAFLRELDQKSNPPPAAPTRPSSSSSPSSSKHLKPSTSAANNSTTIVQLATLHPRPKTEYTSTTYITYTPGSSSKRPKFKSLVPSHLNNPSSSNVASVAQEEEEDEFSSFFPGDDLLASIDLAPPAAVEEPISLPSTPPPLPHAPPNTPDYVPSPETLLALQERLSALPGSSPPTRDSRPSRGAAQPHPQKASPPPSPSRPKEAVAPPPPPSTKRSSNPPTSSSTASSSSSTAADKLAKFRYVTPLPEPEPASPSPPPAASPKPSTPPHHSSSPLFNSQPFASSSSKPKPTSTNPPLPRIKDVYGVDTIDDFFSDAVDPRDGYERVKIKEEEEEGRAGLDASHENEEERDELAEEEEPSRQQEDMVVDFWGGGGMVKKGEESGPPASFVARRDEGEGEEKGWVYEEEGGGGAGFGFEGDGGDGDGFRVSGVGGFVASLPVVREEEEVDELEADGVVGAGGGDAMEGGKDAAGGETLVESEDTKLKVGEGEEAGEKEKLVVMALPPTPESLPRPDRPLNPSTSTDAAPPPRPSFTIADSTPPPSRNLTILSLPSSVLHLILLQTIDPSCLSNLSILLTSKLFHSIARPILYRVVSLRSTQGWSSFFASGSSAQLRSASGNVARRKEDYDAIEELEIHAEASNVASHLARIDMVLALHDISSRRGRTKNRAFVPNSTPFLPKLKKLTLSFPPTSPTSSLDHTVTLRPFHSALLKALSFPTPTVEITLIEVRKSDQVRAVFGTVQGVKKVVLKRPVEGGRRELSEMARTSGGRIEVPTGDEGWVPVERVEEWRKKSVWVGML